MGFIRLAKGLLIDVQKGFVDSHNLMVDCWQNLRAGTGLKLNWLNAFTPQFSLDVDFVKKLIEEQIPESSDSDDTDTDEDEDLPLVLPPLDTRDPGGSSRPLKFKGTDNVEVQVGEGSNPSLITFEAMSGSNVKVTCTGVNETSQGSGVYAGVTVKIGVFYN